MKNTTSIVPQKFTEVSDGSVETTIHRQWDRQGGGRQAGHRFGRIRGLSWIDDDAHPHGYAMHVIERWSRPDADYLAHEVTVEDPKFYTKLWTFTRVFTAMAPGDELYEFAYDENNVDRDGGRLGYGPLDLRTVSAEPRRIEKIAWRNSLTLALLDRVSHETIYL